MTRKIDHHSAVPVAEQTTDGVPDISGNWRMEIHWQHKDKSGILEARADIRQDGAKIGMEVDSRGSSSNTLLAQFKPDASGAPVLHYIFEVEPKALHSVVSAPYKGAAILRLSADRGELSGNYWTSQLSRGHYSLSRDKNREMARGIPMIETVDVLLVTAIDMEFDAAKQVFSASSPNDDGVREWREEKILDHARHWAGDFYVGATPLFRMALTVSSRMGSISTGHRTTVLTERLAPSCVVMCGVCAGNPGDLALGDVIISELVYQYDEGKLKSEGFVGDHRQIHAPTDWVTAGKQLSAETMPSYGEPSDRDRRYWLLERLNDGADPSKHPARTRYFKERTWKPFVEGLIGEGRVTIENGRLCLTDEGRTEVLTSLALDLDPPMQLPFAIAKGPIASGNVVVKDGITWGKLEKMGVRSVLGLEMEGATVAANAVASGVSNWIVVKGVMDYADPKKDDRYKEFAARASAEVLRALLIDRLQLEKKVMAPAHAASKVAVAPQSRWEPGAINGPFIHELGEAIAIHAPRFKGIFDEALAAARRAFDNADRAYNLAAAARDEFGEAIGKAHSGKLGAKPRILALKQESGSRPLIAKIWSSHDEYIGEGFGQKCDGLGVLRVYQISEKFTPGRRSTYAGEFERDQYGPSGLYRFSDQARFAGVWSGGSPKFGYREFLGNSNRLVCDFYLGPMEAVADHTQPHWFPEGEGITVDATARRVRCGDLVDGKFAAIHADFVF